MKENGEKCPSEEKARKKRDDFLKLYNIYKSGSKLFCESCLCRDLCVCGAHPVVGRRKKEKKRKRCHIIQSIATEPQSWSWETL